MACCACHKTHIWFQSTGVWGNSSLRRQPVNHLVVMVMGDCKAEPSLQSLQGCLFDKILSHNMYQCFMNTKYLCACLKRYHANLSLKQG